ncbi:MAG: hypothetical protein AAFO62_08350 [Pseudomonadota bacterium]
MSPTHTGAFAFGIATLLAGCGTPLGSVGDRAESYNTSIADSANRVVALNIVRQSYRAPLHFSVLGSAVDQDRYTARLSANFPFGGLISPPGVFNPAITANDPQPQLNYTTESTQKFETGISRAVEAGTLNALIGQGLPPELVYTLLVDRIEIVETIGVGDAAVAKREVCVNEPRIEPVPRGQPDCYRGALSFDRVLRALLARGMVPTVTNKFTPVGPALTRPETVQYSIGKAAFGTALKKVEGRELWQLNEVKPVPSLTFDESTTSVMCPGECLRFSAALDALVVGEAGDAEASAAPSDQAPILGKSVFGTVSGADLAKRVDPAMRALGLAAGGQSLKREIEIRLPLRSVRGIFAFLGEIAANQLRDPPNRAAALSAGPVIYPGSRAQDLVSDPSWHRPLYGSLDGDGGLLRLSGQPNDAIRPLQRGAVIEGQSPHLLFAVCRVATRSNAPANALTVVTFEGQTYFVPGDRGSNDNEICGEGPALPTARGDRLIKDNRAGQTFAVLLQLLALNRDASELSQTAVVTTTD